MPLASHFPVLDNRSFHDILKEAQARIPRYTPEWTDYGPGDPGMALVELFAWMTELLSFRLNQVPKLSYLKFMELIGIELRPAQSATTVLTFPLLTNFANTSLIVPQRSQVATTEPDADGRPIIFETERSLTAVRARLDALQSHNGYSYNLLTEANIALAEGFAPFGPLATTGSSLLLGFDDPGDFPADVELALAFWPKTALKEPPPAPCGGGSAAIHAPARIVWDGWSGIEWRPINVALDETLGFTRSGIVILRSPMKGQLVRSKIGVAADKPRYWLRARLDRSAYQTPPLLLGVRVNAVRASEAQTANDEVLGGSDGSPGQILTLSNAPVVPNSLVLEVFETETPEVWQPTDDFFGLDPNTPAYLPNWATGEIHFAGVAAEGSGKGGRIPSANADRRTTSIVARTYRFGGGIRGNVPAGAITAPQSAIMGLDPAGITNPLGAQGGADEEDIATAMDRAPRVLKARDRAVTTSDFELLAMEAGTISRARALPLFHPDFPEIAVPGVVTVVVVPEILGTIDEQIDVPAPRPVESLLRTICDFLDARRMLTTELYVVGPVYVPIEVRLVAVVVPGADAAEASAALTRALRRFFHPIHGGLDGRGWPFGGPIRYADLYRAALISGVLRIDDVEIVREGQPFGQCMDVPITPQALVELINLVVSVVEDGGDAAP